MISEAIRIGESFSPHRTVQPSVAERLPQLQTKETVGAVVTGSTRKNVGNTRRIPLKKFIQRSSFVPGFCPFSGLISRANRSF